MAQPLIDDEHEFSDDPSAYVAFAMPDPEYPGDVYYRFHYWETATGRRLVHYDNAHDDPALGQHHRHGEDGNPDDPDSELDFTTVWDHYDRFLTEVEHIHDRRTR